MSSMTRKLKRNKEDIIMEIKFKCDTCGFERLVYSILQFLFLQPILLRNKNILKLKQIFLFQYLTLKNCA